MNRTQQIKEAHPWLSYDEVVKILLYQAGFTVETEAIERQA